ncbi:MAG: hypothetical protein JXA18_05420, partial [Chitinispirillaceae bacterium]|nr:hypothetical protein [Chitinispirillaceae bacterium]
MSAHAPLPLSLLSDGLPAWFSHTGPQADLVISTRIRLARNCAGRRFPYHAGRAERKQVFDMVAAVLEREKEFGAFAVINCASLPPLDRQLLLEERLISPDLL